MLRKKKFWTCLRGSPGFFSSVHIFAAPCALSHQQTTWCPHQKSAMVQSHRHLRLYWSVNCSSTECIKLAGRTAGMQGPDKNLQRPDGPDKTLQRPDGP